MITDYFFDSNILIGSRLSWDTQFTPACNCLRKYGKKHTSDNVYRECKEKFESIRQVIWAFLKQSHEYKGWSFSLWSYAIEIERFKERFLMNSYSDERRKDARKILNSFLDTYVGFFRDLIINGGDIEACSKFVEESIDSALLFLDEDVKATPTSLIQKHRITDADIKEYKSEAKQLRQKIQNRSDVNILLDSYYVKNRIIKKDAICFVTTDKNDIIDKTEFIKGILDGVHIRDPSINPL